MLINSSISDNIHSQMMCYLGGPLNVKPRVSHEGAVIR